MAHAGGHRAKLSPARRRRFLDILRESANVSRAAAAVDISRQSVYRMKEKDPEFAADVDEAIAEAYDVLEEEARRRAMDGVEEGVYFQGEKVDTKVVYSDTLMSLLLKGNLPKKYNRVNQHVTGDGPGGSLIINIGGAQSTPGDDEAA